MMTLKQKKYCWFLATAFLAIVFLAAPREAKAVSCRDPFYGYEWTCGQCEKCGNIRGECESLPAETRCNGCTSQPCYASGGEGYVTGECTKKGYCACDGNGSCVERGYSCTANFQCAKGAGISCPAGSLCKSYTRTCLSCNNSSRTCFLKIGELPGTCFPAGTKINMANGEKKNIEEIGTGEKVLSYDIVSKTFVTREVLSLDDHHTVASHTKACASLGNSPSLYTINNGLIEFTPEHPFWVKETDGTTKWAALVPDPNQHPQKPKNGNWDSLRLKVGQMIFLKGKWKKIESISVSRENIPNIRVYNLIVEGTHAYFANSVLVHNKEVPTPISRPTPTPIPYSCNCTQIKLYSPSWQPLTPQNITAGQTINIAVSGSEAYPQYQFNKGRIRINESTWKPNHETTNAVPQKSNEFYITYTIPPEGGRLVIEGEIHLNAAIPDPERTDWWR